MTKPQKVESWKCPMCEKDFENQEEANTCIKLHVIAADLEIANTAVMSEGDPVYKQASRLPEFLVVRGRTIDVKAVYQLLKPEGKSVSTIPYAEGNVKLQDR